MPLSASQDVCPPSRGLKSSKPQTIWTPSGEPFFLSIFPCLIIFCLFCVKVLQSVPQLSSENRIPSAWKLTERGAFGFFKCVWRLRWRRQTWWNSSAIGGIDELIVLGGSILMSDAKSFRSPNHHSRRGIHNVLGCVIVRPVRLVKRIHSDRPAKDAGSYESVVGRLPKRSLFNMNQLASTTTQRFPPQ